MNAKRCTLYAVRYLSAILVPMPSEIYHQKRQKVEQALENYLQKEEAPSSLYEAMRYSVMAGGKRLRPVLCLASCEAVGRDEKKALPFACALEAIHTYSLIHDDLPCMDNDDFRRGRPTNHKVFGEAVAILAGDALLNIAFEWMSDAPNLDPLIHIKAIREMAKATGAQGLVGGQVVDLQSEGKNLTPEELQYIHIHKTARLIQAAAKTGAILGEAPEKTLQAISIYGENLGLAFQITDDLLDVLGNQEKMGKSVQKDAKVSKATYPSLFGIETSQKIAKDCLDKALHAIQFLGDKANLLREIASVVETREN